jgi:hypothetical protein
MAGHNIRRSILFNVVKRLKPNFKSLLPVRFQTEPEKSKGKLERQMEQHLIP